MSLFGKMAGASTKVCPFNLLSSGSVTTSFRRFLSSLHFSHSRSLVFDISMAWLAHAAFPHVADPCSQEPGFLVGRPCKKACVSDDNSFRRNSSCTASSHSSVFSCRSQIVSSLISLKVPGPSSRKCIGRVRLSLPEHICVHCTRNLLVKHLSVCRDVDPTDGNHQRKIY